MKQKADGASSHDSSEDKMSRDILKALKAARLLSKRWIYTSPHI